MIVVGVQGTWARTGGWWQDGSPLWQYFAAHGLAPARVNGVPFEWETSLGSSLAFWRRWGLGDGAVRAWEYAGKALGYYLDALPEDERVVLAHSHGGQVAFYCAANHCRIKRLVTIGTPNRKDMDPIVMRARPFIDDWFHVSDRDSDYIGFWGMFGDGRIGGKRTFTRADVNVQLPDIGHSRLLSDPTAFPIWAESGLVDFLRGDYAGDEDAPAA